MEREVGKVAVDAVKATLQPVLDRLAHECNGKPLEQVKDLLNREWTNAVGRGVTEPGLTTYAAALAKGQRIILT